MSRFGNVIKKIGNSFNLINSLGSHWSATPKEVSHVKDQEFYLLIFSA